MLTLKPGEIPTAVDRGRLHGPAAFVDFDALDQAWLRHLGINPSKLYAGADPERGYAVTVTDLFCGGGGSTSGMHQIPGVRVRMAANHWRLAIETHNTNHQDTDHDCADISQVEPRRYPRTDVLWASPECTNHSSAKGQKRPEAQPQGDLFDQDGPLPDEAAERSRATMYDVLRFAEYHKYRAIIVENVVEVLDWVGYRGWRMTLEDLGYDVRVVFLNSMHAHQLGLPAPQSRDRVYITCRMKGVREFDFDKWTRPRAVCPEHGEIRAIQAWKKPDKQRGRYRQQYVYRCPRVECRNAVVEPGWLPAAYAIDWSNPGTRIGDRDRPLADKTLKRIEAGLAKHFKPITLEASGHTFDAATRGGTYWRAWPVTDVHATLHTSLSKGVAYSAEMLVPVEGFEGKQAMSPDDPLRTSTTRNDLGLAMTPMLMRPYTPRGGNGEGGQMLTPVDEAARSLTASSVPSLVVPMRNHGVAKPSSEPIDTVSANGNHHALLMPYYGTARSARPTSEAMGALTGTDRYAMITRHFGSLGDGAEMSTPAHETIRTLTTKGHQSITEWDPSVELPSVEDCLFRMLDPGEVKVGMAFSRSYVLLGTKREQVKLAGNAVTPPAARDLMGMVVEALTGAEVMAA